MTLAFTLSGSALTTVPVPGLAGSGVAWAMKEAADKGMSDIGSFHADDPDSTLEPQPEAPLRVTEDAASPTMIAAGYLTNRIVARGKAALQMGTEREWDISVVDLNILLTDRLIETGGKRPAEDDITRIDWLLDSGYLPIGDAGFIDRSSPVSLPAEDYTGRAPADVLSDCSNQSGKTYFVRWEEECFFTDPTSPWWTAPDTFSETKDHSLSPTPPEWWEGVGESLANGTKRLVIVTFAATGQYLAALRWHPCHLGDTYGSPWLDSTGTRTSEYVYDASMGPNPSLSVSLGVCTLDSTPSDQGWHLRTILDAGAGSPQCGDAGSGTAAWNSGWLWDAMTIAGHIECLALNGSDTGTTTVNLYAPAPGPALCYHDPIWSGDSSTIRLSGDPADVDNVTTFAIPQTANLDLSPARLFAGCHYEYSGGAVYVSNPTTDAAYYSVERFGRDTRASDMNCKTAAQATTLATAYLARAATEEATLNGAIIQRMTAAQVNLARQGQRIQVKMPHMPALADWTWMAIAHREVAPYAVGLYDVTLTCSLPVVTGFRGGGFGHTDAVRPASWVRNIAAVVAPATTPADALPGQRVPFAVIGTGDDSTVLFTLSTAYQPGSVLLEIDGLPIAQSEITETDPGAGTITLDFAPAGASSSASAETVTASWQVP